MTRFTRLIAPATLTLNFALCLATPLPAQDRDGMSLMEEGMQLFFRGLMDEMEPALNELEGMARGLEPALRDFAAEMGPALRDLLAEVEDWSVYHPPEILPNGDIIIRRRQADDPEPPKAAPEIEL